MTLRLLLVRHGLSSFNCEKRIQGRSDLAYLTKEGEEQALQAGEAIAEVPLSAIYSSPLQRAVATTEKLLESRSDKLMPIYDEGLLEIDVTPWSGLTIDQLKNKFPEAYKIWQTHPERLVLERNNGSTYKPYEELIRQAKTFLNSLLEKHPIEKDETILIVAHNAILRCLILVLLGEPNNGFRRLKLNNASLSVCNLNSHNQKPYQAQIECLNNIGHLNPSLPSKGGTARLILVRHGETDWNQQGRFQGQIDIPLNEKGKAQALAAGELLRLVQIDKAFTSSMSRPKQTAEAILQSHPGIHLSESEGLVEIGHGLWEGKLESEIKTKWPDLLEKWKYSPEIVKMPEGETIHEVWERSVETWNMLCSRLAPHETALVVAHDAVNKTILCHLLGLSPADIWTIKQGNGGITIVDISVDSGQPAVVTCLNLTSHLGGLIDRTAAGAL